MREKFQEIHSEIPKKYNQAEKAKKLTPQSQEKKIQKVMRKKYFYIEKYFSFRQAFE